MKWRKLDWFNIIKQFFILGLGYSLLRTGIIIIDYYGVLGKTPLPQPGEIAVLIIAGKLFENVHSKLAGANQRRLIFLFCILILTLYSLSPGPFIEVDFSRIIRLVTIYLPFIYGASVNKRIEHYDMLNRLKIYTALLILLSFFVKSAKLFEELLPVLFMYMILSLIILAFYNMEQVGSTMPENYAGSMRKRWIWLSIAVSILLSAGAGLIFSAYNPLCAKNVFIMFGYFYNRFVDVFIKIITPVAAPIIYIFGYIINILKRFVRYQEPEPVEADPGGDSIFAHAEYKGLPPSVTTFFKAMVLVGVIAGFTAVLALVLKKWLSARAEDVEEIRESVFEWKNVKKNIMESMRCLTHMRRPKKGTVEFSDTPAFRVRKLYVDLMRKVGEKGCVREPSQTPLEFIPFIVNLYGEGCKTLIQTITQIYIRARYYPESITKQDVLDAREASKKLP